MTTGGAALPLAVDAAFHSSKRSIQRARHHINDLERAIVQFNKDGRSLTFVEESYASGTKYVVKARLARQIPDELECIAIDAIYNLRSSLDQAIFSVADVARTAGGTGIDLDSRHWSFPICYKEQEANKRINKLCQPAGFPEAIGNDLKSLKPYFNGDAGNSLLYGINKAANINKHRFLTPSNIRFGHFEMHYVSGPKIKAFEHIVVGHGSGGITLNRPLGDDDGTAPVSENEIGFYVGSHADRRKYEVKGSVDIKFSNILGLQDRTCVYQLRAVSDLCELVVKRFSDTCIGLGLCK